MRRLAVAIFFMVAGACTASAETIMLYLTDDRGSAVLQEKVFTAASAVEDGIFAAFFDAGDIIFDNGIRKLDPDHPPAATPLSPAKLASAGGARFLLEVRLVMPDSSKSIPDSASYVLSNVSSGEQICSGVIQAADLVVTSSTTPEDVCILLGSSVAKAALEAW